MEAYCVRSSDWLRAVVIVGLLGFIAEHCACVLPAQTCGNPKRTEAVACAVRNVRSRHFLVHTDLSRSEANEVVERLEAMLGHFSAYWGQPVRGVVECNVIRNLEQFPAVALAADGARGVKTFGGVTLMYAHQEGKRQVVKSVVCASARSEVIQHEVVHAYCHQTFGRIGPVWYSEGMAEMGHYWKEGDRAVHADSREIEFLHNNLPTSLADILSPAQVTGDCWQNYASRWALCHFLSSNPNYSRQFRQLGRGLLAGRDVNFERTYAPVSRELFFEYRFFLEHISRGYRVELCTWNWKKNFAGLKSGQLQKVVIAAGRGWQPTGLTVRAGMPYEYIASGAWQIAGEPEAIDADGDDGHRGRLVGVLMNDYHLGAEFELGAKGTLQLTTDGDLYLRCRNTWNELAGDRGHVTVSFQLQGQGPPLCAADREVPAGCRPTCRSTSFGRQ
jgi:hypothetical protein